jgi:hypothetical protein
MVLGMFSSALWRTSASKSSRLNGGDELLARIGNYEICKAAFEKAIFVYPNDHPEMRQGARIILKSKEC